MRNAYKMEIQIVVESTVTSDDPSVTPTVTYEARVKPAIVEV